MRFALTIGALLLAGSGYALALRDAWQNVRHPPRDPFLRALGYTGAIGAVGIPVVLLALMLYHDP